MNTKLKQELERLIKNNTFLLVEYDITKDHDQIFYVKGFIDALKWIDRMNDRGDFI